MTEALRVLIAVDGSDRAAAAARCWAGWVGNAGQPLDALLLTVAPPPPHAAVQVLQSANLHRHAEGAQQGAREAVHRAPAAARRKLQRQQQEWSRGGGGEPPRQ